MTRPAFALAWILAGLSAACSGGGGGGHPECDLDEVRFEGYATDETCLTMVDAEKAGAVISGGPNAPVLLSPTSGAVVAAGSASLTIAWDTPLDLDLLFTRGRARPAPRPSTAARVLACLSPVSTAHAHEAPVTGAIHRLRLGGVLGAAKPIDVYTSKLDYALDAELLADVLATTGPITLDLTSMYVTQNRIVNAATDGPFAMPSPATITVQ